MSNNIYTSLYLDYGYMLSKKDLVEVLKVSLSTINRRLKKGKLPQHTKIGSRILFPTEAVAIYMTQLSHSQYLATTGGDL